MEVIESQSPSLLEVTDDISSLLEDYEFANIHPISLLPKEMSKNIDKLMADEDPDVTEAKKFFMSLFDEDSVKLNTSLILLVVKAAGFKVISKDIERDGVKVTTSNHQLLCESVQNYLLGHVFHAAMLNVEEYTPSSLLCNKVCTLVGDHFFSMTNKKAAEVRFYPVFSLGAQALTQSIESKFVKLEDVGSWITKHSQEFAMDGSSLKSAVLLGDDKKKEEAEAAYEFGINFSLVRCIKKELQDFNRDKENNNIARDSLPVLHAFAGREKEIETTDDLLEEVVKMKGVEKTIMQMKDLQEKALKNLRFFTSDSQAHEALKNLVIAYVHDDIDSLEKEKECSTSGLVDTYTNLRKAQSQESLNDIKKYFLDATEALGSLKERMEKLVDYNMAGIVSIVSFVFSHFMISIPEETTQEQRRDGQIMGWLLGMANMHLLITDDIVDKGKERNCKPCWYLLPGVGRTAILDSNIILTWIPLAVHHFFGHHECYKEIAVEISKYIVGLTKGQFEDTQKHYKMGSNDIDIEKFTMDRYKELALKKGNSSALLRIFLYLFGERKESLHRQFGKLGDQLSFFAQLNNDFNDVYPGPGKTRGMDIEEGKVTWCICRALEKASPEQKKILEENYGKRDNKCIQAVKKIYKEVNLRREYKLLRFQDGQLIASLTRESKGSRVWGEEGISSRFLEDIKNSAIAVKNYYSFFDLMNL